MTTATLLALVLFVALVLLQGRREYAHRNTVGKLCDKIALLKADRDGLGTKLEAATERAEAAEELNGRLVEAHERAAAAPQHPHLGEMVVVNTLKPDDQSLRGILTRSSAGWLVLSAPKVAVAEGESVRWDSLPGSEVAIAERTVSWMQQVPAEAAADAA